MKDSNLFETLSPNVFYDEEDECFVFEFYGDKCRLLYQVLDGEAHWLFVQKDPFEFEEGTNNNKRMFEYLKKIEESLARAHKNE